MDVFFQNELTVNVEFLKGLEIDHDDITFEFVNHPALKDGASSWCMVGHGKTESMDSILLDAEMHQLEAHHVLKDVVIHTLLKLKNQIIKI